jgi:uncharacterized protein (TIGR02271 family)
MAVPEEGREGTSLPVIEERLSVGKRTVDTGRGVRIDKQVHTRHEQVDMDLVRDELLVERVAVDEAVDPDALPETRTEGDTLVIPVLEEVLVVARQLRLKEEVRITRRRVAARAPQDVALRREEVTVTRFDEGQRGPDPSRPGR